MAEGGNYQSLNLSVTEDWIFYEVVFKKWQRKNEKKKKRSMKI